MRILHVITPSVVSGAELMLLRIAKEQIQTGDECLIVTKPLKAYLERAASDGIEAVEAAISGKLNFKAATTIAGFIRDYKPDIVHTHLSTATLWGARAARREQVPCVAMMQAANSVFVYNKAPAIIAVSEAVKRHLIEHGVDAEKISTVHNSIDPAPFGEPMDIGYLREDLQLPEGALLVGTLAHLAPRKGHKDLLAAIPSILESVPNTCFLWAGKGVLETELKSQVASMELADHVKFLGYRKDAPALHRLFDVFVLPSYIEGLPLVLLEAMACGKPCVATNVAGSPELVAHDETGFLVNPCDPDGLAEALTRLLSDAELRKRMGEAGRRRVQEHFTLAEAVKKLRSVYQMEIERQGRAV